jgi:hypothetical protein
MLLPSHKALFSITGLVTLISTIGLFWYGKPELVPQLWISIVAVVLSYFACVFTAEKLRLDLFDRRFEIYSKALAFCSAVFTHGSLEPNDKNKDAIIKAVEDAHNSFRGIGYHKSRALFGQDIMAVFMKLNESYSYISTFGSLKSSAQFSAEQYWNHVKSVVALTGDLPEHFRPYMYYGDYRKQ